MSATSVISPNNNIHLKKMHSKLNKNGKININHIVITLGASGVGKTSLINA